MNMEYFPIDNQVSYLLFCAPHKHVVELSSFCILRAIASHSYGFFLCNSFLFLHWWSITQGFLTDHDQALQTLYAENAENSRHFNICLNMMATRIATVFASLKVKQYDLLALFWCYRSFFVWTKLLIKGPLCRQLKLFPLSLLSYFCLVRNYPLFGIELPSPRPHVTWFRQSLLLLFGTVSLNSKPFPTSPRPKHVSCSLWIDQWIRFFNPHLIHIYFILVIYICLNRDWHACNCRLLLSYMNGPMMLCAMICLIWRGINMLLR